MASNEEMLPWNLVISLSKLEGEMSSEQPQLLPNGTPVIVEGFWCFTRMAIHLWMHKGKENIEDLSQREEMQSWQAITNSS